MPPEVSLSLILKGQVQGLGIRPSVYHLAKRYHLKGCVQNTAQGVQVDIKGTENQVHQFLTDLREIPFLMISKQSPVDCVSEKDFYIAPSQGHSFIHPIISPDRAPCQACLKEMFDPFNRRYQYPFITCLSCGPRYTILDHLPYDRHATSMRSFNLCEGCQQEYTLSTDRRYHSQTNSCAQCGPKLSLCGQDGILQHDGHSALLKTVTLLEQGYVIGVKGIGGFHLVADATSPKAVQIIRHLKSRIEKPLAIMVKNLQDAQYLCEMSTLETQALCSPQAPIVLAKQKQNSLTRLSHWVAPNLRHLGLMLPFSPVHALLSHFFKKPLVMTSANLQGQSIITALDLMQETFGNKIYYLTHNRDIVNPVDDSIVKEIAGEVRVLRKARGYIPYPLETPNKLPAILSLGGHLKNTVAITKDQSILLSPYIGDLTSQSQENRFKREVDHLLKVCEKPQVVVHDTHPDYTSTHLASDYANKTLSVQHHHAHILACIAEYGISDKVLGFAWDGMGYGLDGTLWGGEALLCEEEYFQRVATFKPFRLLGADKAAKEPLRVAVSLLKEVYTNPRSIIHSIPGWDIDQALCYLKLLYSNVNAPQTSSVGRLFDGVAALLNLCTQSSYEAQAAMLLEDICEPMIETTFDLSFTQQKGLIQIDWSNMINQMVESLLNRKSPASLAMMFHHWLVDGIIAVANQCAIKKIALSGGVFQNDILSRLAKDKLEALGFEVFIPKEIPMNDSGLSVGQVWAAISHHRKTSEVNDVLRHSRTTEIN